VRAHPVSLLRALLAACRTGRNYPDAAGPRYAGGPVRTAAATPGAERADAERADAERADVLRVVSFNVEFARRVDRAIGVLASDPALRGADVVLLQEMDADGTRRVADALGLWYTYYPAILHGRTRREFGNAVLSRRRIEADAKLVLPRHSRYAGTQRTATAATVRVGNVPVRVYSTHLGTPLDVGPAARREQLRAVLADAAAYPRVVVGGDMNSAAVGRVAREAGYAWPTERGPRTAGVGRLDHIFLRGLTAPAAGTVLDVRGASDHRAVWTVGVLS
jgi:endonuclease/exonuclease/phosphatase family metal-dependent hydrolase